MYTLTLEVTEFYKWCILFWHLSKFPQEASALVSEILPESHQAAVPEISVYLVESVGNDTRIDYGTGLTNFTAFHGSAFVYYSVHILYLWNTFTLLLLLKNIVKEFVFIY